MERNKEEKSYGGIHVLQSADASIENAFFNSAGISHLILENYEALLRIKQNHGNIKAERVIHAFPEISFDRKLVERLPGV